MKQKIFTILFTVFFFTPIFAQDIYADWKLLNNKYYEDHKAKDGFSTTTSGLSKLVLHQGYFPQKPNQHQAVNITYTGKLIDGTIFDTGTNQIIGLEYAIPGLTEGIQLMNIGGCYQFIIPSYLGFGNDLCCPSVIPGSTLIFEVTLNSVVQ